MDIQASPDSEIAVLQALQQAGFPLAALRVLPAEVEENFYRLNNLPHQLKAVLAAVDLDNPDEDDVEDAAPLAQQLIAKHYLLDEFIDVFYEGLQALPARIQLRRVGSLHARQASKGRPSLLALKDLWRDDWTYDALMRRIHQEHSIALQARPIIISSVGLVPADEALQQRVSDSLGYAVRLWCDSQAQGISCVLKQTDVV